MFPSNCYFSQYASTCFDLVSVRQLTGLTGKSTFCQSQTLSTWPVHWLSICGSPILPQRETNYQSLVDGGRPSEQHQNSIICSVKLLLLHRVSQPVSQLALINGSPPSSDHRRRLIRKTTPDGDGWGQKIDHQNRPDLRFNGVKLSVAKIPKPKQHLAQQNTWTMKGPLSSEKMLETFSVFCSFEVLWHRFPSVWWQQFAWDVWQKLRTRNVFSILYANTVAPR